MDFYEHQASARRRSLLLYVLMAMAVASIAMAVYYLVWFIVAWKQPQWLMTDPAATSFDPRLFKIVTGSTAAFIISGSLFEILSLRGSGHAVARRLGGRQVVPGDARQDERRLMNVVEEMAIASGAPVPAVFILDSEDTINAFAAGKLHGEPAIGVTRGAARKLNRDELQGVVAHEFSHLLNNDGAINVRLLGVLNGIMLIYVIGYGLLTGSGGRYLRGNYWFFFAGMGLIPIGLLGMLFANIIKAAVSRQREFLADASAVQFTRNPQGLGGALRTIALPHESKVRHRNAPAASHMFFGAAVTLFPAALFATHPPVHERIRRVAPGMEEGVMTEDEFVQRLGSGPDFSKPLVQTGEQKTEERARNFAEALEKIPGAGGAALAPAANMAGTMDATHVAYVGLVVETIPEQLLDAVRSPMGAWAVVCAMLGGKGGQARGCFGDKGDEVLPADIDRLLPYALSLDSRQRMVLLSKAENALRCLSAEQFETFRADVAFLAEADGKVDLFEWMLGRMLLHRLGPRFYRLKHSVSNRYTLGPLARECRLVLSCLAHAGSRSREDAAKAFQTGWAKLGLPETQVAAKKECLLDVLDESLEALLRATPVLRAKILAACATVIAADNEVTPREGLLYQGIADALNIPVPPLLPGQPLI